jgi:hypothetical protein
MIMAAAAGDHRRSSSPSRGATALTSVRTGIVLACCALGLAPRDPSFGGASGGTRGGQAAAPEESGRDSHLITASAMGRAQLKMTLAEARRVLPTASFARTSDGDGAALVEVVYGKDDSLILWADEDDPATPIDWSRKILTIETFSAAFHTREGVHPGSFVNDVVTLLGPVLEIVKSEIESREYITFARQPEALRFRLDYTGVFAPGARRTTRAEPDAKIWSIAISSLR